MYLKILIVTIILVAFVMLALGIKMLFDKNASFNIHSCSLENEGNDFDGTCYKCQTTDAENCPEIKGN
jgi:hypothetical protein